MRWRPLATITLTSSWQFVLIPTGSFVRLIHSSVPSNPTAWICQAEKLIDNTFQIFNQQALRPQGGILKEVFKLEIPEIFSKNYVGLRQKFSGAEPGWEVQIEEADLQTGPAPELETIFSDQIPAIVNLADNTSYSLGLKFQSTVDGYLKGIRFWKDELETGVHVGKIWKLDGTLLTSVYFTNETSSGWQEQFFTQEIFVSAATTYLVSVNANYSYVTTRDFFNNAVPNKNLVAIADGSNGVYGQSQEMPGSTFRNANYFRDVFFVPV